MKYAMKNLIICSLILLATGASFAQQPTPLPQVPSTDASSSSTQAQAAPAAQAPSTAATTNQVTTPPTIPQSGLVPAEPSAAKPEEKPQAGTVIKISPAAMFKPLIIERSGTTYVPAMSIEPGLAFNGDFTTATNKTMSLAASYDFGYEQYLNKGLERSFSHDINASMSQSLNPKLSLRAGFRLLLLFNYTTGGQAGNSNNVEAPIGMSYKLNDKITLGLGYFFNFFYNPNVTISYDGLDSISNPPSDSSDLLRGTVGLSEYYGLDASPNSYMFPATAYFPPPAGEKMKFFLHGITAQFGYTFSKETSLTLKYHFYPNTSSNKDTAEYIGHQFYVILSQSLWEKGKITIDYRLRRRSFGWDFTEVGNTRVDYRHRLYTTVGHDFSDYFGIEAKHEYERSEDNKNGSTVAANNFYLGAKFSF
jgi:hypothetical protein